MIMVLNLNASCAQVCFLQKLLKEPLIMTIF